MNIALTTNLASIPGVAGIPAGGAGGNDFADALGSAISEVESSQQSAKSAAMDLLAGGKGDIHSVALASQRAELSLELFQQVRNKFVTAYQEIMKTPM
jgi:flagellar hook-basal body complex protein FliE